MGSIYRRGKRWSIKYYRNGKPFYESTHSTSRAVAVRLLKKREGEIAVGKIPGILFDKVRFDELAEDLERDHEVNSRKSLSRTKICLHHLLKFFGGRRVTDITTADIERYIKFRQEVGVANGTINRELNILKRSLYLGVQRHPPKVNRVLHVPLLKEDNVRTGFFEHSEYLALLEELPEYFRPVLTFGYHTGWRAGEITGLTWDKVDFHQGVVRLNPGETKSGEGRTIYLNQELHELLSDLHAKRTLDCPWVFHRNGKRVGQYYEGWKSACRRAGLEGKLFHDLRRTAVRNLVRSGISEGVAMKMTGHKTRSIFDRYNIVSPEDLKVASEKHGAYLREQSSERKIIPLKKAQEANGSE